VSTRKPRLNVTLTEDERLMLEAIAYDRGLSLARVVGQLIREEDERASLARNK
jgi:hypothetical protein